jgi:NAD(P)-dependent dehydrogenase (short-subunit alcohol dehydrogenase family)
LRLQKATKMESKNKIALVTGGRHRHRRRRRGRPNPQLNASMKAMTTLGRVGVAEDIGGIVAFLCTEDACWITAQRIEASGGMNL